MKDEKQMAVKSVPHPKLKGKDLVKEQHVKVSSCVSVYVICDRACKNRPCERKKIADF